MKKIYMDYNATTPILAEVKDTIIENLDIFGNPSSMHQYGREAKKIIDKARQQVADLINADPKEILFTSCGSESNNLVLKGNMCKKKCCSGFIPHIEGHIITSTIEHPSVLNTCAALSKNGKQVTFLEVDNGGLIKFDQLEKAAEKQTDLVSIMWANNEIGTIQDMSAITEYAHSKDIKVHTDAVQAIGKIPVDVKNIPIDFLSISGHKIGAPKGIGVLYLKKNTAICPLIHGGHQEACRRAGTENTIGIAAIGKACEVAKKNLNKNSTLVGNLRDRLENNILQKIPEVMINGDVKNRLPHVSNITFKHIEGESILLMLDQVGIAVSTGSACSTGSLKPSHVLLAIGLEDFDAHGSIRFSLGPGIDEEQIDYTFSAIEKIVKRLRVISPLG